MSKHIYIANILQNRDSNLNLLRFIFAALVIVTHSYDLLNLHPNEPLVRLGFTKAFSYFAVEGFFIISGFLIFYSCIRNKEKGNLIKYTVSRIFRIFPALIVMCFLISYLIGPLLSTLESSEYLADPRVFNFFIHNSSLLKAIHYQLPGVFQENFSPAVCGSLWTLPYELLCYIFCPLVFFLSRFRKNIVLFLILVAVILYHYDTEGFTAFTEKGPFLAYYTYAFGISFMVGAVFCTYRNKIKLQFPAFAIATSYLLLSNLLHFNFVFSYFLELFAFAYMIFYLAYYPKGSIRKFNKLGDYSYGLYIWGFPVQQFIIGSFNQEISPILLIIYAFLMSLAIAALSWHLIEAKFLKIAQKLNS